ncbi:MAG: saccharopine dehydrogenase family protein [Calditrichia bacterium]
MGPKHIFIAGAGGIGRAAALLLRELDIIPAEITLGDISESVAQNTREWLLKDSSVKLPLHAVRMEAGKMTPELEKALKSADILLDCLPGSEAPRMAQLARDFHLHYANLTEYVKETEQVINIAKDAETGYILQTGLAPGFVDVLANGMFTEFCETYRVEQTESVQMKVGALTRHANPPHFYGFTWSPVGVATLYLKPAQVIRNFQTTVCASLSERSQLTIDGVVYEEDLTSGGAADLPVALAGKTRELDYKTLRYPGHYAWVESLIRDIPRGPGEVELLQKKMEAAIPLVEDDLVVIYCRVIGYDREKRLRAIEKSYKIGPVEIGGKRLRAIQATTAAGLVESARILLTGNLKGVILQSEIPAREFLTGPFVSRIYQ